MPHTKKKLQRPGANSTRAERDAFNKAKADERKETSKKAGNLQKGRDRDIEKARTTQKEKLLTKDLPKKEPAPIQLNQPEEKRKGPTAKGLLTAAAIGGAAGLAIAFTPITAVSIGTTALIKLGIKKALTTPGGTSRIGLTKLTGKAGNIQPGKFVTIPLSGEKAVLAKRFATNSKSVSLTQKLWLGLGFSVSAAFLAKDIYGTYPYAEFIGKEEALQTVGIPIFLAIQAGDLEGAEKLIEEQKVIIASDLGNIPFKNVRNAIVNYQEAQKEAIIEFERLIAKQRGEIEFERQSTGEVIAERDVERKQEKADELEFESEFFRLIREGKQQEADDLQKTFIKKLRGEA